MPWSAQVPALPQRSTRLSLAQWKHPAFVKGRVPLSAQAHPPFVSANPHVGHCVSLALPTVSTCLCINPFDGGQNGRSGKRTKIMACSCNKECDLVVRDHFAPAT